MKAVICTAYGPPEVLQLGQVAMPLPKLDQVRVRLSASAVTTSDCIVRSGHVGDSYLSTALMRLALGFRRPRNPILGMAFSGTIESAGENVKSFQIGDEVYGWDLFPGFGAYAEYKCLSETGMLCLKPHSLNHAQAAAVPFGALIAVAFLRKARVMSRHHVMVYGASGAIGTSAVQLLKHMGARVTAVCSGRNLELVRSLGADEVLDYDVDCHPSPHLPYDVIFDAVGKRKSSGVKENARRYLNARGISISVDDGKPMIRREDLAGISALIDGGRFVPVIDRTYPLEAVVEAHRYVDLGHKCGNVVLCMDSMLTLSHR